jgi:hypothetical protein
MVGVAFVEKHIPLSVIGLPPSLIISPPLFTLTPVSSEIDVVFIVGVVAEVLNVLFIPYEVPDEFVPNAL